MVHVMLATAVKPRKLSAFRPLDEAIYFCREFSCVPLRQRVRLFCEPRVVQVLTTPRY